MNKELKEALEGEILSQIQNVPNFAYGSEEQKAMVDSIAKLYKLRLDEEKILAEADDQYCRRENETADLEMKAKKAGEEKIFQYVDYGLKAAQLILPLLFYGKWMAKGFSFEETGTFTSTTFRGLFSKFRPTGK